MPTDSGFYQVDTWGPFVGEGVSGAKYCTLSGVAKVCDTPGDYVVANEFICARVGLALGLPVPPGVIAQTTDGKAAYVSLRFGKLTERPPHVMPADLVADHPRVAAGIVLFDSLILNTDRHAGNLAYSRAGNLPVNIFDHSHALLGPAKGDGPERVQLMQDQPGFATCLTKHVVERSHFEGWLVRIEGLADELCHDIVDQAHAGGALPLADDIQAAKALLINRKKKLRALLDGAIAGGTFQGIKPAAPKGTP